jgi:hypothetical protein
MQEFTINTPDGFGEATKTDRDQPWDVNLPACSFRFYGSITQVKAEIKRIIKRDYGERIQEGHETADRIEKLLEENAKRAEANKV